MFSMKSIHIGWLQLQGCGDYINKSEIRWLNGEVDYHNNDGYTWTVRNYQGKKRTDFSLVRWITVRVREKSYKGEVRTDLVR